MLWQGPANVQFCGSVADEHGVPVPLRERGLRRYLRAWHASVQWVHAADLRWLRRLAERGIMPICVQRWRLRWFMLARCCAMQRAYHPNLRCERLVAKRDDLPLPLRGRSVLRLLRASLRALLGARPADMRLIRYLAERRHMPVSVRFGRLLGRLFRRDVKMQWPTARDLHRSEFVAKRRQPVQYTCQHHGGHLYRGHLRLCGLSGRHDRLQWRGAGRLREGYRHRPCQLRRLRQDLRPCECGRNLCCWRLHARRL